MSPGFSPIGTTPIGGVERLVEAVELASDIPRDAKEAIKDFVKETYQNLWENLEELINLSPPTELVEYWEFVIELVQKLIG
jgi:hypothetical protein